MTDFRKAPPPPPPPPPIREPPQKSPSCIGLSKSINYYSPLNYQKTLGFLMILGAIKVNLNSLKIGAKFDNDPLCYWSNGITLDVSWTVSHEITLVSVCQSVSGLDRVHLKISSFLKIGLLAFSIVDDDNWLWYLVTDGARFWRKTSKIWRSEFGPSGPKSGPKLGFLPFSQVWLISFHWICIQW